MGGEVIVDMDSNDSVMLDDGDLEKWQLYEDKDIEIFEINK